MNSRLIIHLGFLGILVLLNGCGGGTIHQSTTTIRAPATGAPVGDRTAPQARTSPPVIYVTDFYLTPDMIQSAPTILGNREGPVTRLRQDVRSLREPDPATKARALVTTLGQAITRELNQANYRAEYRPSASVVREEYFSPSEVLPKEGWLLGGWFEKVQEPNRVEAAAIGFGTGSGKVAVEVIVSDLAGNPRQPFLHIGSGNAKHRMPGGLVTLNPYAIAAKFMLSRGQTERDVKAMGSAIAKCLIQYLQRDPNLPVHP